MMGGQAAGEPGDVAGHIHEQTWELPLEADAARSGGDMPLVSQEVLVILPVDDF
jgi:hypothetical protein